MKCSRIALCASFLLACSSNPPPQDGHSQEGDHAQGEHGKHGSCAHCKQAGKKSCSCKGGHGQHGQAHAEHGGEGKHAAHHGDGEKKHACAHCKQAGKEGCTCKDKHGKHEGHGAHGGPGGHGGGGQPHGGPGAHSGAHGAHGGPGGHGGPHAHAHGGAMQHDFSDAASWAARFDNPERDVWQKPDEVVKLLDVRPGMAVVDLGAGTGYFGARLSKAVGPKGAVIALDPEKNMVAFMQQRFTKDGLTNVKAQTCPLDGTGLGPNTADRVLVVNTWHHIEKRPDYAKHLATVLKPGGFVAIVDFTLESEQGPPKEFRLSPDAVKAELTAGGLQAETLTESLPDQYIVVGRRAK